MRDNPLTIVVPYYDGARYLPRLLETLPRDLPVVVVDDQSPARVPETARPGVRVVRTRQRGYFAGAVNRGLEEAPPEHDVLILNQDVVFTGDGWRAQLTRQLETDGVVGDFVRPNKCHQVGYVQGTFMAIRADVRAALGGFDAVSYPHWGTTCHYQMRACRAGWRAAKLEGLKKWFVHERDRHGPRRYGSATEKALRALDPNRARRLIITPPLLSVVVTCYNKARYIDAALRSLFESKFQDFEIIVVDDGSTDGSQDAIRKWVSPWTYVRAIFSQENQGVPAARNAGVAAAFGPLIFQLDGDDKVHPEGLGRMVDAFVAGGQRRWIYSDLACFGDSHEWRQFPDFDSPHPYAIAVRNVAPSCILYPKRWWSEVGGYHAGTARGHDDWGFGIQLTLAGHCGQRLQSADGNPTPAVYYRKAAGSRNATSRRRHQELVETRKKLWPAIFKGYRERWDMSRCCGQKGRRAPAPMPQLAAAAEKGPLVWVTYTGKAAAHFPIKGAATGTRYTVTPGRAFQVYAADLPALGRRRDFQRVEVAPAPAAPPTPAQAALAEGMQVADDATAPVPDPDDMTVAEALAAAKDMDLRALLALEARERDGRARVTLLAGIDQYKAIRQGEAIEHG